MFACIHGPGAAASGCAYQFSPRVEELDASTVVVDASGLERLFGDPAGLAAALARRFAEQGFSGAVAIAANPDAAVHAARGLPGVTVIPRGEEAARLAPLPVALLDPGPEILETLGLWGIRTFRDLAALPEIGIAERLGPQGVRLQQLARGAAIRQLRPVVPELVFEQAQELDYPITELEPLSFTLSSLLHELCASLEARALAILEVHIELKLENQQPHIRALRLPAPTRDIPTLLKLMQLDLSAHPPDAPVVAVTMRAEAAKPRATQGGLYSPPTPEPEKLELTLARIAAIVGAGNVGAPELVDTHRPGAFRLRALHPGKPAAAPAGATLALRRYRPPLPARVQAAEGRPARISARGVEGIVLTLAGPWRTSGDWWTPDPWARDEWDVALSDGALYRIYFERTAGRWFVEASYD